MGDKELEATDLSQEAINLSQESTILSVEATCELESSDSMFLNCLDHSPGASPSSLPDKMSEFNNALVGANLAFTNYMISELILNTYKVLTYSDTGNTTQEAVKFIQDTISTCELQKSTKMKSRSGETFDVLGSDDCYAEGRISDLSSLEHSQLKETVLRELENKVEELMIKERSIKETFGDRGRQQADHEEHVPHQEKVNKLINLYSSLAENLVDYGQKLEGIAKLMEELVQVQQSNLSKGPQMNSISVVIAKVKCLKNTTSIFEEKIKLLLSKDKDRVLYLNTRGLELKQSVASLKERLSSMQTTIDNYRSKERQSPKFRELVKEYDTIQYQLRHKLQTWSVLNESHDDDP